MAAAGPREAVAIKGRDSRSPITSETELTTIHSSSDRVFKAEGQTKMQHSAYGLIVLLTLTAIPLSAGARQLKQIGRPTASRQWTRSGLNGGVSPIRARLRRHSASLPETDAGWLARS